MSLKGSRSCQATAGPIRLRPRWGSRRATVAARADNFCLARQCPRCPAGPPPPSSARLHKRVDDVVALRSTVAIERCRRIRDGFVDHTQRCWARRAPPALRVGCFLGNAGRAATSPGRPTRRLRAPAFRCASTAAIGAPKRARTKRSTRQRTHGDGDVAIGTCKWPCAPRQKVVLHRPPSKGCQQTWSEASRFALLCSGSPARRSAHACAQKTRISSSPSSHPVRCRASAQRGCARRAGAR